MEVPRQENPIGCQRPGCRPREANGGQTYKEQRQMQARGAGRRDDWQRLMGDGDGQFPGGLHSALGDKVGSSIDKESNDNKRLLMGGR